MTETRHGKRRGWVAGGVALAALAAAACFHFWGPRTVKLAGGRLRVALCQYDSRPGEYRWNAEQALRYAREAAEHGAGVIVLPEYSFCTAADALDGTAFREMRRAMRRLGPRLRRFCRRHRCYLFVNLPHEEAEGEQARHNRTLVYAPDGRVAAKYDKRKLAAMDEMALVREGEPGPPLELGFGKVGLMVCKDTFRPEAFGEYRAADLIVVQFAHITDWMPEGDGAEWLFNDMETAHGDFPRIARDLAREFGRNAVFANKAGLEPDGAYTGGSCVAGADGEIVARAGFGGAVLYADFELDGEGRLVADLPPVVP